MKLNATLKNVEVKGIKVGEVSCNYEVSLEELKFLNAMRKECITDLPKAVEAYSNGINSFYDLFESIDKKENEREIKLNEELNKEVKKARHTLDKDLEDSSRVAKTPYRDDIII